MEPYERCKLVEAFKEGTFAAGEFIIRQGEEGDTFYFIEKGEARATKVPAEGGEEEELMKYTVGDYFGERALIKNEPRAANVQAVTDCHVVTLDRHSFKRLLGPLEDILSRKV